MIRELRLKRRRSRIPWMFLVYQPLGGGPGRRPTASALPAQKRRDVERRAEVQVQRLR